MKIHFGFRSFLIALITIGAFIFGTQAVNAVGYGGGFYINLCGTGTSATSDSCNRGCSTSNGSCSGTGVVKYTCDGRVADCRSNESGFSGSQSIGSVSCGKTVQIDVFNKNCRQNGQWTCSDSDMQDYMTWYSGDCVNTNNDNSCSAQSKVDTQFRKSGSDSWVSGSELTNKTLKVGDKIDVNCFAKTGTALLPGAEVNVRLPDGSTKRAHDGAQLRDYQLSQTGDYRFTCNSTSISSCSNSDTITVRSTGISSSPAPSPNATPIPEHASFCTNIQIVSGNNQTVPSTVTLRASGRDTTGSILAYRFYFGDGQQIETNNPEVAHKYESSGTFIIKVDVKDSTGKWVSSDSCQGSVHINPSSIESHRSACSDVFIKSQSNSGRSPSTVDFQVTGFDNKGDLQGFKLDYGDGTTDQHDDSNHDFEHGYGQPGTYLAKGYVKDSQGNWQGGDDYCRINVYVQTEPLTSQPSTGTPTLFSIIGVASGISAFALYFAKKKLLV